MLKIKGLDQLSKNMDQLAKFAGELDGEVASVSFDPHDPASIEAAIQEASDAIDNKASTYSRNEMVQNLAGAFKEKIRDQILERAATARAEGNAE